MLIRWYELNQDGVSDIGHLFTKCSPRTICGNQYDFWFKQSGEVRNIYVADVKEVVNGILIDNIESVFISSKESPSVLILAS